MNKILSLNMARLYVKELGTLGRNVLGAASTSPAIGIIPAKLLSNLTDALAVYDGAVGKLTPSEAAALSASLDDERDNIILALKGLVMAANYRSADFKVAGRLLETAIRRRGWQMQVESYVAETNAINQLLGDINSSPELQGALTLLTATELVSELALVNKRFEENERSRVATGVAKGGMTSVEAVAQLRGTLQTLFNFLNSVAGVYPEVVTTINSINGVLEPFVTQLKTRVTINEKSKIASDTTTPQI